MAWRLGNAEKVAATQRRWRSKNIERDRKRSRAWHVANKDEVNAARRAARSVDPEPFRNAQRRSKQRNPQRSRETSSRSYQRHSKRRIADAVRWARENPEKYGLIQERRRKRVLAATVPGISCGKQERTARASMWGFRCAYCGGTWDDDDHTIPLSRGGRNVPANLRPVCRSCNAKKGSKKLGEWSGPRK